VTHSFKQSTLRNVLIANKYFSAQVTIKEIQNLPAKEEENNTTEAADIEMPSRLYNGS